jgi:hypothetical protein
MSTPVLNSTYVEKDFIAAMIQSYNDLVFNSTSKGWNMTFSALLKSFNVAGSGYNSTSADLFKAWN